MRTPSFTPSPMRSLSVHPADIIERLKKEKPDANMEDLVKEADEIVAAEMKERQKQREGEAASTDGTIKESEVREKGLIS